MHQLSDVYVNGVCLFFVEVLNTTTTLKWDVVIICDYKNNIHLHKLFKPILLFCFPKKLINTASDYFHFYTLRFLI